MRIGRAQLDTSAAALSPDPRAPLNTRYVSLMLALVLVSACAQIDVEPFVVVDDSEPPVELVSLHLEGIDFGAFDGYTVYASVPALEDLSPLTPALISGGTFLVIVDDVPSELLEVDLLEVFLFFDQNGDGLCDLDDSDMVLLADLSHGDPTIAFLLSDLGGEPPTPCLPGEPPPGM